LGRSRGGFTSKFHLVADGQGVPLNVEISAGQTHDSTCFESVFDGISIAQPLGRPRTRPTTAAGDKGYSCQRIRQWLKARGIKPVIPHKDNEQARFDGRVKFDKAAYRRRAIIENVIGWLKECRRVATRFEKLAINFQAMLQLAMIQNCLKIAFSARA
jgi:transposase